MGAARRLHRVAAFQRVSVRYVFRIAFGREADRITGGSAAIVRFARNTTNLIHSRLRPGRVTVVTPIEPQIEDRRSEPPPED
jgi:hypothetical protein